MSPAGIRLVVNADDLGLHPRIDAGILEAHARGIVTSATVLVTGRTAPEAVKAARAQGLALGVHLCLVGGLPSAMPQASVGTVAPGGQLRKRWVDFAAAYLSGRVKAEEIVDELRAQLARARALGAEPDHLDTHQHLHLLPGLAPHIEALAAAEGLPLRWPAEPWPSRWTEAPAAAAKALLLRSLARLHGAPSATRVASHGLFESGRLDETRLLAVLDRLGPGDHELCCHPGKDPGQVPEAPGWRYGWETELAALCSDTVRARIAERGITLCGFRELGTSRAGGAEALPTATALTTSAPDERSADEPGTRSAGDVSSDALLKPATGSEPLPMPPSSAPSA